MGHERSPSLPKTKRWRDIVDDISALPAADFDVVKIAENTLANVDDRLRRIHLDHNVSTVFGFLVALSHACRFEDPHERLAALGYSLPRNPTLLKITQSLRTLVEEEGGSLEYRELAQLSAVQALSHWYQAHEHSQSDLFRPDDDAFQTWKDAGTGSGFCELSRLFFSNFIEGYLRYFLDREASAALSTIDDRKTLDDQVGKHVDNVSHYAFETARIGQSFAAGWFNRHARKSFPSDEQIEGFVAFSFKKIREELGRDREWNLRDQG